MGQEQRIIAEKDDKPGQYTNKFDMTKFVNKPADENEKSMDDDFGNRCRGVTSHAIGEKISGRRSSGTRS